MYVILLFVAVFALTGCGKTYDQILKTAHDAVDIAGKVIDDVKDNGEAIKDAFQPEKNQKK
jgi:hypothetical protein